MVVDRRLLAVVGILVAFVLVVAYLVGRSAGFATCQSSKAIAMATFESTTNGPESIAAFGCGGPTDTPTYTNTPTVTRTFGPSNTPTISPTVTLTPTPTITLTPTPTGSWTLTPTSTRTFTLTPTSTPTWTMTITNTPTRTPTSTFTASATPTSTATATVTPTGTISPTDTPTATPVNQWYVSRNGNNADGRTWATAWNELNQIKWSSLSPGDVVSVDGGSVACASPFNAVSVSPYDFPAKPGQIGNTCGMTYLTAMTFGQNGTAGHPITIRLAVDAGRNGTVVMFGGRLSSLPYCNQSTYSQINSGTPLATGIVMGQHSFVTVDGVHRSGFDIYGFTQGMTTASTTSNVTIQNVEAFDNGVAAPVNTDSSFGTSPKPGTTGWWSDGWAVYFNGGSGLTFSRDLFHDEGQDIIQGNVAVTDVSVVDSWFYFSRENPTYAGYGFNTGTGERCTHPDALQMWGGANGSIVLFDHDIIGPYLGQGIYPTDTTTPRYDDVTISNTTFFNVVYDAINVVSSNPLNWVMFDDTFYRFGAAPDGNTCCTLDSNGWDASNTLTDSISYGGNIAGNGLHITGSSNLYYNSFGDTLPGGTLTNPAFASGLGSSTPTFAQLSSANLTATCGGACIGVGSPLPTFASLLALIDSLN